MADASDRLEPLFVAALGGDAVTVDSDGVDGLGIERPTVRVTPDSVEQIADALRVAVEHDAVVVPTGSGSALALGNLPRGDVLLLSTAKLNETVDYEPRDLTAIVQAGRTLAAVQEETGAEGQMLALDPPNGASATVGGLVATNASGPLRQAYGSTRDVCLGATVVLSDGSVVKCGGRVVKNVAGYDTTRLYVGSMGTLGIVVDAAFRIHPVPETTAVVVGVGDDWAEAAGLARRVVGAPVEPRFVELLDIGDARWGIEVAGGLSPAVLVGFGGSEAQVTHQTNVTREALTSGGAVDVWVDRDDADWRARFADAVHSATERGDAVVKVGGVMADVLPAMQAISDLVGARDMDVQWLSHYTSGVVYAILSSPPAASIADVLGRLRRETTKLRATAVVVSAPVEVRRLVDVWGAPTAPLELMRQLKRKLDPTATLNRGRFVRGLDA